MTHVLYNPFAPPARLGISIPGVRNALARARACFAALCDIDGAIIREIAHPSIARGDLLRIARACAEARG